jgi:aspartate kinase
VRDLHDVDGIYTADPRIVPDARKIERISYEAILELASLGAKVMASRSILFGMKYNVRIHVRHSMLPDSGTWIVPETQDMEAEEVTGVALKTNLGRITLTGLPGGPGVQSRIFAAVSAASIMVDDIIQSETAPDHTTVSFTVDHADLVDIKPVLDKILRELGRGEVQVDVGLCKVSAVGWVCVRTPASPPRCSRPWPRPAALTAAASRSRTSPRPRSRFRASWPRRTARRL